MSQSSLRALIDKLIDIENTGGTSAQQDLLVAGVVGSSGATYELGSAFIQEADEEAADMLGIKQGDKYVQLYLGN